MPWRRTLDPYGVWVSEIMLQQTQVKTVIPYWERWMRELPTPQTLAEAPTDQVLRLWEGLGYYSRARNLQRAAIEIVERHRGRLPDDPAALLGLPGIGRYTAGAIASIAFNRPEPILDGNIIRVLSRIHAVPGDPKAGATSRRLWSLSGAVVAAAAQLPAVRLPSRAPLVFSGNCSMANQALMELGATTCFGTTPRCGVCPLRDRCRGFESGEPTRFPQIPARGASVSRRFATVLWTHRGRWLVRKRPQGGLNPDLWELPNLEIGADADADTAIARWIGIPASKLSFHGKLRRTVTTNRITEDLFRLRHPPTSRMPSGELRWAKPAELAILPMMAKHRALTETSDSVQVSASSATPRLPHSP